MEEVNLFEWLVRAHYERNLPECAPYVEKGAIHHPADKGRPVPEGRETKAYEGILIFRNGSTLLERLVRDRLVNPMDISQPREISTIEQFFEFQRERGEEGEEDGVYVYESASRQMVRVSKIKDMEDKRDLVYSQKVPPDFIFYGGARGEEPAEKGLRECLGTKTRLAMDITDRYPDVHAYQIKRSAYAPLGMGKVTHFDKEGLREEFFLADERTGVLRSYLNEEKNREGREETRMGIPPSLTN